MAVVKEDLAAYAALMNVQEELKSCKGQTARDKNGRAIYTYRSAEDILEAVKPLCKAHGLALHMKGETVYTDEITKETRMVSTLSVVDIATGGEIESKFEIAIGYPERMGLGQWYGAVASYGRKYALCALFAIDNSKDIDLDSDVVRQLNDRNTSISPQKAPQSMQTVPMANNTNGTNSGNRGQIMENLKYRVSELKLNASQVKNIIRDKFRKDSTKELNDGELETLLINLSMWKAEKNY